MSVSETTPYDIVDYPGHAFPDTHPWRLAAVGILHGMAPADVRTARVLELGCGDGANLVPMAYALPDATFTGIDLAPRAIARGRAAADALGLRNLALEAMDLMDFAGEEGAFDYVIAHGLYSWVPEPVRDRALALCGRLLAPQGIAFVSYLARPGTQFREPLRDLLLERTAELSEPAAKIARARQLMRVFSSGPTGSDPFQELARSIAREFEDLHDGAIYHDWLTGENAALRVTDFVAHAGRHGLRFLGEAEYFMTRYEHDPMLAAARDELSALEARDPLLKEQYLDLLRGRRFRQTLLCRSDVSPRATLPSDFERLAVSSRLRPEGAVDPTTRDMAAFRSPVGSTIRIDHPAAKAALLALADAQPAAIPFDTLCAAARARSGSSAPAPADAEVLARVLLACTGAAYVEPFSLAPAFALRAGERPRASAVARYEITRGPMVTTLRHGSVRITDPLGGALLALLDGSRDRSQLATDLAARIRAGELPAPAGAGSADGDLADGLERSLEGLARSALLEA
jgi:SAM-dependent methyltransferase